MQDTRQGYIIFYALHVVSKNLVEVGNGSFQESISNSNLTVCDDGSWTYLEVHAAMVLVLLENMA